MDCAALLELFAKMDSDLPSDPRSETSTVMFGLESTEATSVAYGVSSRGEASTVLYGVSTASTVLYGVESSEVCQGYFARRRNQLN